MAQTALIHWSQWCFAPWLGQSRTSRDLPPSSEQHAFWKLWVAYLRDFPLSILEHSWLWLTKPGKEKPCIYRGGGWGAVAFQTHHPFPECCYCPRALVKLVPSQGYCLTYNPIRGTISFAGAVDHKECGGLHMPTASLTSEPTSNCDQSLNAPPSGQTGFPSLLTNIQLYHHSSVCVLQKLSFLLSFLICFNI